jgi:hypothetical protein
MVDRYGRAFINCIVHLATLNMLSGSLYDRVGKDVIPVRGFRPISFVIHS